MALAWHYVRKMVQKGRLRCSWGWQALRSLQWIWEQLGNQERSSNMYLTSMINFEWRTTWVTKPAQTLWQQSRRHLSASLREAGNWGCGSLWIIFPLHCSRQKPQDKTRVQAFRIRRMSLSQAPFEGHWAVISRDNACEGNSWWKGEEVVTRGEMGSVPGRWLEPRK